VREVSDLVMFTPALRLGQGVARLAPESIKNKVRRARARARRRLPAQHGARARKQVLVLQARCSRPWLPNIDRAARAYSMRPASRWYMRRHRLLRGGAHAFERSRGAA